MELNKFREYGLAADGGVGPDRSVHIVSDGLVFETGFRDVPALVVPAEETSSARVSSIEDTGHLLADARVTSLTGPPLVRR